MLTACCFAAERNTVWGDEGGGRMQREKLQEEKKLQD